MARRRSFARRGPSRTRMLDWTSSVDATSVNTAAGVVRSVVLLSEVTVGAGQPQTLYRIVGTIDVFTQADLVGFWHIGIYKADSDQAGPNLLDPANPLDVSKESWLWWTAVKGTIDAGNRLPRESLHIPIDIKVKRIVQPNTQDITLGIQCNVAHASSVNLRILSKVTGTR